MTKTLKIDIVSDVSCPWCAIGYQSISKALDKLEPNITAIISWKPFELNPKMSVDGQLMGEHLHEKYGSTPAEVAQTMAMITERGKNLGFTFNFKDEGRIYNTFNAHRLLYWARSLDKQTELKLALFGLYFTEGGNPGDSDALVIAAEKAGLPAAEARKILDSNQYAEEVRTEEIKFLAMDINSVPTFIINDHFKITGGQPVEIFVEMLQKAAVEG
ncbi:MAG: DsbA family oxidoreductase [Gallionellaceae bacterium]